MREALTLSLLLTSLLACGGKVVFESGDGDEGGAPSGPPSQPPTSSGLPPGVGGNMGPPEECNTPADCPLPQFECAEAICDASFCVEVFSPPGAICSAGICDGAGFCVECLGDSDCFGPNEVCDVASGTCFSPTQTGVCVDTFCSLLPANNDCANCVISSAQGVCSAPFVACNGDPDGMGCATCIEFLQGSPDPFCPGSQAKFDAFFGCVCQPGVCLD